MGSSHYHLLTTRILVLALWCGTALTRVKCMNFSYSAFEEDDESKFIRYHSEIEYRAILVTPDTSDPSKLMNQSGLFLREQPMKLWRRGKDNRTIMASFTTTFVLKISPIPEITASIGEGLAFVLAGSSILPDNSYGQWLGMVNTTTNGTPQAQIVAVEFDTSQSFPEDIDGNHVGLDVNSVYSMKQVSLSDYSLNLSGGSNLTFTIQYDASNISVFVATGESLNVNVLVLTWPIDLSMYLPQKVYVGFSGSTGSTNLESNHVLSWNFQSSNIDPNKNLLWVWIAVPSVAVLLCGVAYYFYQARLCCKKKPDDEYPFIEQRIRVSSIVPVKFSLQELRRATANFSPENALGKGSSGTVYRGVLGDKVVAVKRLSKDSHKGEQEFVAEVTTIGGLSHKNLVKLIGWCFESNELLIVSDFMVNGSLDKFISGPKPSLTWEKRHGILFGVAQALDYLHSGCEGRVVHRDVKASNVLLDSEFSAKLGDFGLARTIQQAETHHTTREIAGTAGYMAPELFLTGRATPESDVYAFGVLALEVVTGRSPKIINGFNSTVSQLWKLYGNREVLQAVDSRLWGEYDEGEVRSMLILGLGCCHPNPHKRPSMRAALKVLSGEDEPPILQTEMPTFVWPSEPFSSRMQSQATIETHEFSLITKIYGR